MPERWAQPAPPRLEAARRAAEAIRQGEVVAARTDTLYGLLADAGNETVLRRLFRLKGRPENKPILVLIDSVDRLDGIVGGRPPGFLALASHFWPGPLTLVLPARPHLPELLTAGTGTVAVRLPRSPLVRGLARLARRALTGTSANRSGIPGARSAEEVAAHFGRRLPLILDSGRVARAEPSTIVDLAADPPRVLREGRIPAARVLRVLETGAVRGRQARE